MILNFGIKRCALLLVAVVGLPSALACQSPVGAWTSIDATDEDEAVFRGDGTGFYAYHRSSTESFTEDFSWRFITERKRSTTPKADTDNYALETNVIEVLYQGTPESPESLTEYLICTGDHMVGQVDSIYINNTIYQHRRMSLEPELKTK